MILTPILENGYVERRVDWGLPWLQAEVCFLCLPPGFPAVPQYYSHTFGCSPVPLQKRASGFPIHTALRPIIQIASKLRNGFRSFRILTLGHPTRLSACR